ncbi:MAG: hypothetical protein ACXWXH_11410 [Aeromicrobium sp.]
MGRLSRSIGLVVLVVVGCGGTQPTLDAGSSTPGATNPGATAPTRDICPSLPPPSPIGSPPVPSGSPSAEAVFRALPDFPAAGAFEVTGVTIGVCGWVAAGFGAPSGEGYFGHRQGVVWRSGDGTTWQETVEPQLTNVTPLHVASLGTSDFVVGLLRTCAEDSEDLCEEPPDAGNGVWRSIGGGPWERLPVPPGLQAASSLDELAVGLDRLVISGTTGDDAETATVWISADGSTWSQTTDLGGLDPIYALAGGPPGLVAFGTALSADEEFVLVNAATSADGSRFTPASVPQLPNAAIESTVAGPIGMSGVGYAETEDLGVSAAALYSADGLSWVQASAADGSFENSGMLEVHALPAGYVALGFRPSDLDFAVQEGHSWISRDGQSWTSLAPIGEASSLLTTSAVGPAGLVVFTASQEETEFDVTSTIGAWFAPRESLTPP